MYFFDIFSKIVFAFLDKLDHFPTLDPWLSESTM